MAVDDNWGEAIRKSAKQKTPGDKSEYLLETSSTLKGLDSDGEYAEVKSLKEGALSVSSFSLEVAKNQIQNHITDSKFGRNRQINTTTVPETIWSGSGVYNGYPVSAGATEIRSSSISDGPVSSDAFSYAPDSVDEMRMWLRAGDNQTVDGSGFVTTWGDKSGNGYDVTSASGGVAYNSSDTTLNNQPVLDMSSDTTRFAIPQAFGASYSGKVGATAFLLVKRMSFDTLDPMFDIGLSNGDSKFYSAIRSDGKFDAGGTPNTTDPYDGINAVGGNITTSDWFLHEFNMDLVNDTIKCYVDNALEVTESVSYPTTSSFQESSSADSNLFALIQGAEKGDYKVAEVVFYSKTLSPSERDSLVFYFNDRYDLAMPYITGDPTVSGNGARSVRVSGLDLNLEPIGEDVLLSGESWVDLTRSYKRLSRAHILSAGSSLTNIGDITVRRKDEISNIFAVIPSLSGEASVSSDTVPKGKSRIIKRVNCSMSTPSGVAGSASVSLRVKDSALNGAWRSIRDFTISTSQDYDSFFVGGIVVDEKFDIEFVAYYVDVQGTQINAEIEFFDITK